MQTRSIENSRARVLICDFGKRMYEKRLISGCAGNLSMRLSNNHILMTPGDRCKGELEPDMLVEIDAQGALLCSPSDLAPSSEKEIHLETFRRNSRTNCVIHAHPINVTALSLLHFNNFSSILPETLLACGKVGIADFALPGSTELVKKIIPLLEVHDTIILKRHGSLTLGSNIWEAYYRLESLEHTCEIIYKILAIEKPIPMSQNDVNKMTR